MRYRTVQLPAELADRVKRLVEGQPALGYVSVKGFVEDAVRRRLEQLKEAA